MLVAATARGEEDYSEKALHLCVSVRGTATESRGGCSRFQGAANLHTSCMPTTAA